MKYVIALPLALAAVAVGLLIFFFGLALEMLQIVFGVNLGDGRDWA